MPEYRQLRLATEAGFCPVGAIEDLRPLTPHPHKKPEKSTPEVETAPDPGRY